MPNSILSDVIVFREAFLSEGSPTIVDRDYGPVLRIILFYLWRGCSLSRTAGMTGRADANASLLSLSAYEATLGVLQLIRIGYHADAIVLARALMERIAVLGYLGEHRDRIARYWEGRWAPYKEALAWAKTKSLPNWMNLYSTLSGVAHSAMVGPAGHINNRTEIGNSFRRTKDQDSANDIGVAEELLGLVVYALAALDPLAFRLIQETGTQPFGVDVVFAAVIGVNDTKMFREFLQRLINRYEKSNRGTQAPA